MDRSWVHSTLFTTQYVNGVTEFMNFVKEKYAEDQTILCPCTKCLNQKYLHQPTVKNHILMNGMDCTYTRWVHHGEDICVHVNEVPAAIPIVEVNEGSILDADEGSIGVAENDNDVGNRFDSLLRDLQNAEGRGSGGTESETGNNGGDNDGNNGRNRKPCFLEELLKEAKRQLYPGCAKFSRLSFVITMLHMKSFYRVTNTAFSAFLKYLADAFPEHNTLPRSYEEAKKLLKELGLGYDSIHVCINNCILFRRDYASLDNCPVCGMSRWKDPNRKKIPQKVLRHFPLVPRLQRLFVTKESSESAQWHKLKRKPSLKEMSHPADGEAWQDFDKEYPDFADDPRNLRLGIATDGFNPFGNFNTKYSMWPVFVMPYNLPPWACMDQSNLMMALLIPGPSSPGKDFDLFLQPLVEELIELWKGVPTYDAIIDKEFTLRGAVLWCIHDYPALSTLLGRTTKGYYACTHCDKNPLSYALRSKIAYIGHYRLLPRGHSLRRNNEYGGLHGTHDPPGKFTTEELLAELEKVSHVKPGMQQKEQNKKRKRSDLDSANNTNVKIWSRRMCLWDLEYWKHLKVRHNLDVMHIEKNICESLLATILGIYGKTKDTVNARLDCSDLKIKENLQFIDEDDTSEMPRARYNLSKDQKAVFCKFLTELKFPDGYSSNISRCVSADGSKVQGLKTHDCHILLQRILAAGLRGLVDKDIYETIAALGNFFKKLCSKTLNKDVLVEMKAEIVVLLCKLEKIFPPALFDVMWHLAVHLPEEALLRGPVQYGWMYPIERRLYTLKRYVRNRARPEGSIAEAYIADECLTFCSKYMDDVETRFNRDPRNVGFSNEEAYGADVFGHGVRFTSSLELVYDDGALDEMGWYVLNNCNQVAAYIREFRAELESEEVPNIEKTIRHGFQTWFRNLMLSKNTDEESVDDDIFSLACGPMLRISKYKSCIVNGVRFNTVDRDMNKKTQNSGIMSLDTHDNSLIQFYGNLKEIIQLEYSGDDRSVVLFKCDWYKLDGKNRVKDDGFYKSINVGSLWYKTDSLILATQATKVFYLPDTRLGKNWQVVQTFDHRHLYNVSETCVPFDGPAYQEEACVDDQTEVTIQSVDFEPAPERPVHRDNEPGQRFKASEISRLRNERPNPVYESGSEDEDEVLDDTLAEYCSEEDGGLLDVDSDDE